MERTCASRASPASPTASSARRTGLIGLLSAVSSCPPTACSSFSIVPRLQARCSTGRPFRSLTTSANRGLGTFLGLAIPLLLRTPRARNASRRGVFSSPVGVGEFYGGVIGQTHLARRTGPESRRQNALAQASRLSFSR